MSHPNEQQRFIFSETIDSDHLYSLYENDYQWIEEIFTTALTHFDEDVNSIRVNQQSGDMLNLKKAIHKIKPTFGFVGMPHIQDMCKTVEDKSAAAITVNDIQADIDNLLRCCEQCKSAMENDLTRLISFNKSLL